MKYAPPPLGYHLHATGNEGTSIATYGTVAWLVLSTNSMPRPQAPLQAEQSCAPKELFFGGSRYVSLDQAAACAAARPDRAELIRITAHTYKPSCMVPLFLVGATLP